jgi:hypothetical protein
MMDIIIKMNIMREFFSAVLVDVDNAVVSLDSIQT